jgi:ribose transport system permease protein
MDAIAASVLGGTSMSGGVGSVIGTFFGALIIALLNNALTIMNISSFWQMVIKGLVIIIAVTIDIFRNKMRAVK